MKKIFGILSVMLFMCVTADASTRGETADPGRHERAQLFGKLSRLADSIAKTENKDVRRLKELRASVENSIADIDQRIGELETAVRDSKQKDKGLGGSLLSLVSNNFRQRKLTWLRDMRGFLLDERDHIDAVISGVVKVNDISTSKDGLKVKLAEKLRGLF